MDKSKLLDQCGALGEDRTLLARVLDRAKQASERNIPAATDFLSPAQQAQTADLLHAAGIPETAYICWGGYDGAERAVLLFLPDWMDPSDVGTYSPIRCLRAAFREEENLTHRDFLGSLMGMGIVREKIGDILVGPDSADVLVLDTVAEFLAQSWESAGRVKLQVAEIDPRLRPHPGDPTGGTAGYGVLPAAGRRVLHRLPHGPGQGGGAHRKRPGAAELAGVHEAGSDGFRGRYGLCKGLWEI